MSGPVDAAGAHGVQVGSGAVQHNYFAPVYLAPEAPGVRWPVRVGAAPMLADCHQPRTREMETIGRALASGGRTVVLHGLGGVGKSQLASFYRARWLREEGRRGLTVWAPADSRSALTAALVEAARAVAGPADRLPERPDATATWFLSWLSDTSTPWLVVLDDVADPAHVRGLWPPANPAGATLVTTRRTDAAFSSSARTSLPLGMFSTEQARAYLEGKLGEETLLVGVEELAEVLHHLPLALAQAAAYILDRPGENCARYSARYGEGHRRLDELFPADALADDYQSTIAATWALSMEVADRLPPAGLARSLLEVAAVLDPHGFGIEVLTSRAVGTYLARRAGAVPDEDDVRHAVAQLARLSLVTWDREPGPRSVRVHALVQRATRDRTDDLDAAVGAAGDALVEVWTEDSTRAEVSRACRDNAAVLLRSSEPTANGARIHPLVFRLGHGLRAAGHVFSARDHWERRTTIARAVLGGDAPEVLELEHQHADAIGWAGAADAATRALVAVAGNRARVLGAEHDDTLESRRAAAFWRGFAGDPVGAVADHRALLSIAGTRWGDDDHRTLRLAGDLARFRGYAGDPGGAAEAFGLLAERRASVLGSAHADTLGARANEAHWLGEAGEATAAADRFAALLVDRLRVQGADDPEVLATRTNLARWRGESGNSAEAIAELVELVDGPYAATGFGPDHPRTLIARAYLARFTGMSGDPAAASELLAEIVADRVRVLGAEHPFTLSSRAQWARWRAAGGQISEASAALDDVLADQLRVLGPEHPDVAATRGLRDVTPSR